MAKSNDITHQTNGQQLSYSWLGTGIFKWFLFLARKIKHEPSIFELRYASLCMKIIDYLCQF